MEDTTASPGQSSQRPPLNMEDQNEEWQVNFLKHMLDKEDGVYSLFTLLTHLRDMNYSINPTLSIVKMLQDFAGSDDNDLNTLKNRERIQAITSHISLIIELREHFNCFNLVTGFANVADEQELSAYRRVR